MKVSIIPITRFKNTIAVADIFLVLFLICPLALYAQKSPVRKEVKPKIDSATLEAVVISIGYGKVKKSTYVGAAAAVTPKDMAPRVATSFANKLDGLIPGFTVGATGRPGSSAGLNIRGTSSLSSGNSPLIILNGMQYQGTLESINTEDIQEVVILKDAASTAIYGSRASGGVVLIKTKTGRELKSGFEISVKTSFGTSWRFIPEYERVNPEEYYELIWTGIRNNTLLAKNNPTVQDFDDAGRRASRTLIAQLGHYNIYDVADSMVVLPGTGKINPNVRRKYTPEDWAKAMLQRTLRQEHSVSLASNSGHTNYYVSFGYLKDPGIIFNSDFYRYAFNFNLNSKVTNWLKVGTNLMYRHTVFENAGAAPFGTSRSMPSIYPVYLRNPENGAMLYDPSRGGPIYDYGSGFFKYARSAFTNSNSIAQNFLDKKDDKENQFSGRLNFEIQILPDLIFRSELGSGFRYFENLNNSNQEFGGSAVSGGQTSRTIGRDFTLNIVDLANYHKKLGNHNLDITLGHEFFSRWVMSLTAARTGFPAPRLIEVSNGAVLIGAESAGVSIYRLQGIFTRFMYNYKEKYAVEGSVRADQSSVFRPGHNQWGVFWAVGAGWDIAKEAFMEHQNSINQLKLRASFGFTGNDRSRSGNFFLYQDLFSGGVSDLNLPGALRSRFGVPDIRWESVGKGNIGLDIGLFKNRLNITIDAFYNPVSNMLYTQPLAPSVGLGRIVLNIASMYTNGFELDIKGFVVQAKNPRDFSLKLGFNAYWQRNEITKFPEAYKGRGLVTGNNKFLEGQSINRYFIRRYAGVNEKGQPMWYMKTGDKTAEGKLISRNDANGKPIYDEDGEHALQGQRDTVTTNYNIASRYYLKSSLPYLIGAIHATFDYKGFNLYMLLKYRIGGQFLDLNYARLMSYSGSPGMNLSKDFYNEHATYVKQGNEVTVQNNGFPLLGSSSGQANAISDRFLFDASYLSIKNITLSYAVTPTLLQKIRLKALSFFLSLENIAIFSHLKSGASPEGGGGYPMLRALSGGVNLRF